MRVAVAGESARAGPAQSARHPAKSSAVRGERRSILDELYAACPHAGKRRTPQPQWGRGPIPVPQTALAKSRVVAISAARERTPKARRTRAAWFFAVSGEMP